MELSLLIYVHVAIAGLCIDQALPAGLRLVRQIRHLSVLHRDSGFIQTTAVCLAYPEAIHLNIRELTSLSITLVLPVFLLAMLLGAFFGILRAPTGRQFRNYYIMEFADIASLERRGPSRSLQEKSGRASRALSGVVCCIRCGNRVCFDPFQIAVTIYQVGE
jgi:hypothetical protein